MGSVNVDIESGASEQQVERLKSPLKRLVIGLLLMVVVAGALGAFQLYHTRMQLLQQAEANSRALADILQQAIGAVMHKTDTTLLHVVDEVVHQSGSGGLRPDELRRFVERQFRLMPELDSLRVYDSNGTAISGSGSIATVALSQAERDTFTSLHGHGDAGMVISKPFEGTITCARRINLEGGAFGGVVYAVLPLQQFNAIFKGVPVGARGAISLRSDDLTVIARYAAAGNNKNHFPPGPASASEAWQTLLRQGESERGSYTAPGMEDGVSRIYSYTRISAYPLYVSVGLAMDDTLSEARQEVLAFVVAFMVFLGMSGVLIRLVDRNWLKAMAAENVLKRNYERLQLMQQVSQHHASTVQELLDFSLEKVIALTESSIGYIYNYNEDNQEFVLNSWSKDVMAACTVAEPQSLYQLGKTGIWGEVVRQRKPIVVNDYAAVNPLKRGCPEGHVPLSRFLTIPVLDDDRIVAVVGVANKVLPYDQTDVLQLSLMMEGVWKIANRLLLEEHILRAGKEWQSTFDSINDSIALIDADQRVIRCNRSTCDVLGRDFAAIINQPCCRLFHDADTPILDCPTERARLSLHSETTTFQHNDRWLEVTVDPILSEKGVMTGAVHIVRDVTENRLAEEALRDLQAQMMQNDKLATIGQLAAGVAHEINNPMGFVSSNMTTLAKYIEKYNRYIEQIEAEMRACTSGVLPEPLQALRQSLKLDYVMRDISVLIEENNEGIDRVKRIVQDLRTFSRADSSAISSTDLNRCMDSTINVVMNEIKYAAELKRDYGDLPTVHCNAQQINQVFMNLLMNAAHAIQAKGEEVGEIGIRTWCEGGNAFVSVSDNGCGIAPENCSKIFDAFYTTKEVGKGTGLGLSISSGLVRKHGGEIHVASEVGVGSTFTVRLPLHPPQSGEMQIL
ncbi:MAG: GAF domain-containing protein [Desulfuromonadaceae bacterium]|nr:GAF domain-containing protein [Desulfuromonadaceae bacterium]MDD2848023.1 GAF domain-containing protein [Desulfuromonadaceae bacterium]MDD4131235.1 GAF domain-containing protein [Desulfuromonadaceae bacterium]